MKWLLIGICTAIVATTIVYAINYFSIAQPVNNELASDSRDSGINFSVHYRNYLLVEDLDINLKNISNDNSPADVFRCFLEIAKALKGKKFETIFIEYKGIDKFKLKGDYFEKIGQDYDTENPIYTIRTFPENVYRLNDDEAFPKVEGGFLGVLSAQMDNFNKFNEEWYKNDLLNH